MRPGLRLRLIVALCAPAAVGAQSDARATSREADRALERGDITRAAALYARALAIDSGQSRAAYQLAVLRRDDASLSKRLLEHYVRLEPGDAWGHLALGQALVRGGRPREAVARLDAALALEPGEIDALAWRGRARLRTGDLDGAVADLRAAHAARGDDAEIAATLSRALLRAERPLEARQAARRAVQLSDDGDNRAVLDAASRASAAVLSTTVGIGDDSDENRTRHASMELGSPIRGSLRVHIGGQIRRATDPLESLTAAAAFAGLTWRPRSSVRIEIEGGAAHLGAAPELGDPQTAPSVAAPPGRGRGRGEDAGTPDDSTGTLLQPLADGSRAVPTARVRVGVGRPGGARLELRARSGPVTTNALLLGNRLLRDEVELRTELPVAGPLRVRGGARVATLRTDRERNARSSVFAGPAIALAPWLELNATGSRLAYSRASREGYFAPREALTAEIGSYVEREDLGRVRLALDLGAGVQRVARFDATTTPWTPALRAWSSASLAVAPGREIVAELDAYDAEAGPDAATTPGWRSLSLSLGVRWTLR